MQGSDPYSPKWTICLAGSSHSSQVAISNHNNVPADRIELSCNQLLFQRLMRARRYTGIRGNGRSRSACDLTHQQVSNLCPLLENSYFQFVEKVGYAPTPVDFQSTASTKLASSPMLLSSPDLNREPPSYQDDNLTNWYTTQYLHIVYDSNIHLQNLEFRILPIKLTMHFESQTGFEPVMNTILQIVAFVLSATETFYKILGGIWELNPN